VGKPLSARARLLAQALAFLVPLALWCAISYVPFLWHPLVLVQDPGDTTIAGEYSYIASGERVDRAVFEARNAELAGAGARLAQGERVNPIYLPAPHEVAKAFYTAFTTEPQRRGDYWLHESLWQSILVIFWGFVYSAILGVPLGVVCGTFPFFAKAVEPFVDFVRYMPAPVFGALAVAVFGLGQEPKVAIIFIGTFFQMVLVVANTTRQVDWGLIEAAQTLGASNAKLVSNVVVPSVLPRLFTDMRILVGWAWTYLVVAELIGEKSGLSAFLYQQQRYQHFENVYAGILILGAIGLVTDQILAAIGSVLFPWQSGNHLLSRARAWLRGRRTEKPGLPAAPAMPASGRGEVT
jgi:NitT/TauT family transport system permease protein